MLRAPSQETAITYNRLHGPLTYIMEEAFSAPAVTCCADGLYTHTHTYTHVHS